ncbi:MAG TPA: SDR family oxidoreductase [Stellaceae bacterium]|nr:SDR family oxidoreductase [Stellaceae bacterium]
MRETKELERRVALVTGASRNIGRAIALDLADAGAAVVINTRASREAAAAVAREVENRGGQALLAIADVTDEGAVQAMLDATIARFGRLDIVVNNAAVRPEQSFEQMALAEFRAVVALIVEGAFICAHAALPHLRRSDGAAIINIGGTTGHTGAAGRAHVVAGKAGLVGLTKALAHELSPEGITVNCVVPGLIATANRAGTVPGVHLRNPPLVGRRGQPEDVAAMVRHLAGPAGRYITGQTIHVNGGAFLP